MAFTSLASRMPSVPLVLAGPILRKVTPTSVTVWIALKEPGTVTLRVMDASGGTLWTGSRATVRMGRHVHLVAVTASRGGAPSATLAPGQVYLYDLGFQPSAGAPVQLLSQAALGVAGRLAYAPHQYPSFSLPPPQVEHLHLVHASCRKLHGEAQDAFVALDTLLTAEAGSAERRPHQLFLTGDQVYADDVADAMLHMLMDAAPVLMGWSEGFTDGATPFTPAQLKPGKRGAPTRDIVKLTSGIPDVEHAKSHLLTLSEFLAMYLFAWSPALWPAAGDLPAMAQALPGVPETRAIRSPMDPVPLDVPTEAAIHYATELRGLRASREALPRVRKALANVPTYMMMDDHEVTDDWNLNRRWLERVLTNGYGRRLIENALIAFAVCQAWGNTPERFDPAVSAASPGAQLLGALDAWGRSNPAAPPAGVGAYVGAPDAAVVTPAGTPVELTRPASALDWHYVVEGPQHNVLVLDTRTMRRFDADPLAFPYLLSETGFQRQIEQAPLVGSPRVLFVVAPAPTTGPLFIENAQRGSTSFEKAFDRDTEAWGLQDHNVQRLLSALATHATPSGGANAPRRLRVVFLSGDVHYTYATRTQYWADRVMGKPQLGSVEMILAQLTSSSLHNETGGVAGTRTLHRFGWVAQSNFWPGYSLKVKRFGWELRNNEPHVRLVKNVSVRMANLNVNVDLGAPVNVVEWESMWNAGPTAILNSITPSRAPDWRYRLDFLTGALLGSAGSASATAPNASNPGDALRQYAAVMGRHQEFTASGKGREIVGRNNFSQVQFGHDPAGRLHVIQTAWFAQSPTAEPAPNMRVSVSLDFADPQYPAPGLAGRFP